MHAQIHNECLQYISTILFKSSQIEDCKDNANVLGVSVKYIILFSSLFSLFMNKKMNTIILLLIIIINMIQKLFFYLKQYK